MDNNILKQLLTEYDSKRMYALKTLEDRKEHLREISSKYTSLEKDMQNISLEVLKAMLNSEDTEKEKKLKDLQQKTNENSHEFFSKNNYAKEIASAFKETDDTLIKNFSALFCMQVLENSKIKQSDGIIILEILRTSLEKTIKYEKIVL